MTIENVSRDIIARLNVKNAKDNKIKDSLTYQIIFYSLNYIDRKDSSFFVRSCCT